jgi:hypothetical protein
VTLADAANSCQLTHTLSRTGLGGKGP